MFVAVHPHEKRDEMIRRLIAPALLASALLASMVMTAAAPAMAQQQKGIALSQEDRADVARVEAYVNGLRTLKANFLQLNNNGGIARGTFYLQRPGKMRFEYEPPTPVLMVADGTFLIYYDSMLQQISYLPLGSTPIGVLVRDRIQFSGELTVTGLVREANTIRISMRQTKEWDQGELTLVFSDNPLKLEQWTVLDAQRQTTRVTLINPEPGIRLDPKLFEFEDPKFSGRQKGN